MKQLEKLINNQEERIYTIGDLENLSASRLYGFDPSRPSWGGFSISPISQPSFPNLSHQFSYLDSYGKKEEKKEWSQLDTAKIIKEQYDKENKKSKPLSGNGDFYFREIPSLGDQLHVHPSTGFSKLKKSDKYLSNYEAAMIDLQGEKEGGKSGGNSW